MGARAFLKKNHSMAADDIDTLRKRSLKAKDARQQVIVTQTVQEAGGDLRSREVAALARVLHTNKDHVREMVETARSLLAERAVEYVDAHKKAVDKALHNGDAKSLEVAARATQWAMEHIKFEGKSIVDKPGGESGQGTQIIIGIKLGGQNTEQPATVVEAEAIPVEKPNV